MNLQPIIQSAVSSTVAHAVKLISLAVGPALAALATHGVAVEGVDVQTISLWIISAIWFGLYYILHHTTWGAAVLTKESAAQAWIVANAPAIEEAVTNVEKNLASVMAVPVTDGGKTTTTTVGDLVNKTKQ